MKNKSCALVCWILFFSLPAFALEIKLSTREVNTIPWIPITINVDVINDSSAPVEIPMVGRFSFGAGNICMNYMRKADGTKPNQKEFDYMVIMSDQAPGPWKLTTETLRPGETRSYSYSHGKAIEPMELEYWVECNFLSDPEEYKKNNIILDHKIFSGKIKSNVLKVQVDEPAGVDALAYNEHWKSQEQRNRLEDSRKSDYLNHLKEYPRSRYSEYLICQSNPDSSIPAFQAKRPEEYVNTSMRQKRWTSNNEDTIQNTHEQLAFQMAVMKVLQYHPNSNCKYSKRLSAAESFISNGSFNWACRSLNEIIGMDAKSEVDKIIKQKANQYVDALKSNGYCQ
jgi:hypothetical protein